MKLFFCPTYNKPERPGITESIKSLSGMKMYVKIMSLKTHYFNIHWGDV